MPRRGSKESGLPVCFLRSLNVITVANVTDFEELFELFFDEAFIDRRERFLE